MKNTRKLKKKQIGVVGVDSGQLIICDPSYLLHDQWKGEGDMSFLSESNGVEDQETGRKWVFPRDFPNWQAPLAELDGKSINDMVSESPERFKLIKIEGTGEFSYAGCCRATMSGSGYGQLNYEMGHEGAAVAFTSGYGDGAYPVFGYFNEEGRVVKVEVIMDEDI
ncbi:MAG: DUF4241 domain-containing protein [Proteobacteria bacterium]|nr:DUF4241 domain-containing protein [Pseudomonadota bacterium]